MKQPSPSPDRQADGTTASRLLALLRSLAPFAGVALFVGGLVVLHGELSAYGYGEILAEIRSLPARRLLAALALTVVSFGVLSGYETLAVRYAAAPVRYSRVIFASFLGYAFSQALGSPLLTGAPVRYRLYTAWKLSSDEITRIVGFYTATSWIGALVVVGAALLAGPGSSPASWPLSPTAGVVSGLLCVGLVASYLLWTLVASGPLRIRSWKIPVPSPGLAAGQMAVGVLDWLVGAAVLYVLLPSGHGLGYLEFVALFTVALGLGQMSLVPGGLGVFEAILILLLPEAVREGGLVASLVGYRTIYFLLPLVLAAGAVGGYELSRRREAVGKTVDILGRGISTVVPLVLAGLVFLAGVFLLMTGALPLSEARLAWFARALPLPVLELSHFLGSLVGGALLILAWGLRQRLDAAYRLTVILLGVGAVLSVSRGLGWLETGGLLLILGILLPARREFFRKSSLLSELPSRHWLTLVTIALASMVWLGLLVHRRVDLTTELWWEFTLRGDAPRFLRASVGVAVLLLGYGLARLLRPGPADASGGLGEGLPPAVDQVVATSERAHAALIYLGDKRVLLSHSGAAFVMYGVEGRSWVSLGDPVGAADDYDELVWRFRELVHRHAGWPVFYQAHPEFLPLYADVGLSAVKLGEEAYVPLGGFSLEGSARKGLRKTVRKADETGADVEIVPREQTEALLPELREVSDAWLEEKEAREKGFSLGFFSEEYLRRTPIAVLRLDGRVVAFLNVLAGGNREELSADLMRYRAEAPPSSMEYLFVRLMLWGAENGYRRFSLGMAPLAGLETGPLSPLWNRVGAAVFRYGEHFYNFRGLRAYKGKFDPVWEPRYLVTPGGLAFPRILANLATLVGGGVRGVLAR